MIYDTLRVEVTLAAKFFMLVLGILYTRGTFAYFLFPFNQL